MGKNRYDTDNDKFLVLLPSWLFWYMTPITEDLNLMFLSMLFLQLSLLHLLNMLSNIKPFKHILQVFNRTLLV